MKEATGSAWIFTICLTFIILMTGYLAISVNYAKAFRIKSYIVTSIEENEGYDGTLGREIETYLTAQGYAVKGECPNRLTVNGYSTSWRKTDCLQEDRSGQCGVCIYEMPVTTGNDEIDADRKYYRVVAFFNFDIPIVNVFLTFSVGGESKYIYDINP